MQEDVAALAEGYVREAPKAPQLEKADITASLRSKGNEVSMDASNEDLLVPGLEEDATVDLAQEASSADKGKSKMPAEQGNERAKPNDYESNFDLDLEDHTIIDSGITQVEV